MKIKDKIKINVFPHLIIGLHKLGFNYEKLGTLSFFIKSILLAQTNKLGKQKVEKTDKPLKIYVLTILSFSTFHLLIESLLALGLQKKGHHITFIIDDSYLAQYELRKFDGIKDWINQADAGFQFASLFLSKLNLNFISVSKFLENSTPTYDNKYNYILDASLLKNYKVGVITKDLPFINEKTKILKNDIAITSSIGKKLADLKPDITIMSHGIYSTWGPIFDTLNFNNLDVLTYGRGKKKHTLVFNWNKTASSWDVSREWEKVKDKELTKKQLIEIENYLDSRILHKNDVFIYNFGKETTKLETIEFLGLDKEKPIYTLFTNVLWDAASTQREIAFKNPIEWVIETIEWFNNNPQKQLIVKIHPAEVVIGTNMPFYDIILSRVNPHRNIRIIKPEEKVNSWSIYAITDLGLVHTTTAGMELPLVNKPCAVVSKTHFRGKGFTFDINSKKEYFELLDNFDDKQVDYVKNKKEAFKYAHLLFYRFQIPFNMFFEETTTDIRGYRFNSIDDYFNKESYAMIIDSIIKREDIFND